MLRRTTERGWVRSFSRLHGNMVLTGSSFIGRGNPVIYGNLPVQAAKVGGFLDCFAYLPVSKLNLGKSMNMQAAGHSQSLIAITVAIAGAVALVTLVAGASAHPRLDVSQYQDPQCGSRARAMVSRSHSMLEGKAAHAAVEQAYQTCQSEPAAFRNLLR